MGMDSMMEVRWDCKRRGVWIEVVNPVGTVGLLVDRGEFEVYGGV
jgi:hypothetical protein